MVACSLPRITNNLRSKRRVGLELVSTAVRGSELSEPVQGHSRCAREEAGSRGHDALAVETDAVDFDPCVDEIRWLIADKNVFSVLDEMRCKCRSHAPAPAFLEVKANLRRFDCSLHGGREGAQDGTRAVNTTLIHVLRK